MSKSVRKVTFNEVHEEEVVEPDNIEDLPTSNNKFLTTPFHLPILLMTMFKRGLTQDVKSQLIVGLITLISIQLIHDYIIFKFTVRYKDLQQSVQEKKPSKKQNQDNVMLLLFSSIIIPLVMSIPTFIILILLGAPLSSHIEETFLLSMHISIILINPLIVSYKLNFNAFGKLLKSTNLLSIALKNQQLFGFMGCVIGTWLGVIPLALDWDRPWQNWPITLLSGGYLGYFIGTIGSLGF